MPRSPSGSLRSPRLSTPFSSRLACRLLAIVGSSSLGASYVACGGSSATGAPTTGVASSSTTGPGTGGGTASSSGAGGSSTGGAGTGGSGGSSGAGFVIEAGIESGPPPNGTACFSLAEDAGGCPSVSAEVIYLLDEHGCTDAGNTAQKEPATMLSGPTDGGTDDAGGPVCCYEVTYVWCVNGGRPYLLGDAARVAPLRMDARGPLAAAWARDGQAEHASIASFARFSLALLAHGAPADLVELAHRAALDEVRHAELCFALASGYAGEVIAPGRFPLGDVEMPASLEALAVATVREGCIGETVSAIVAAEQLARATDPAVRAALSEIVPDEARHAELAWKTVAWALEVGGEPVRRAVEEAFTSAGAPAVSEGVALEEHGRLDADTMRAVATAAMADVVGPAARALLAREARA